MSKVYIENENLTNVADAIRGKLGSTDTYKPAEMAEAVNQIDAGGGETKTLTYAIVSVSSSPYKDVYYYDLSNYITDPENQIFWICGSGGSTSVSRKNFSPVMGSKFDEITADLTITPNNQYYSSLSEFATASTTAYNYYLTEKNYLWMGLKSTSTTDTLVPISKSGYYGYGSQDHCIVWYFK